MKEPRILVDIQCAKDAVASAEGDLGRLLGVLHAASRAEKTTISQALRDAFRKLRVARELLVTLEKSARG